MASARHSGPCGRSRWRLALALFAALASAHPALSQSSLSPGARAAWGFDRSDLEPHPDVRFGVLGNGMRYAIMRNAVPAGGLAVRLRIDVGAGAESSREQGFVHLLEHMIFEGSANLPRGALLFMLPAAGLKRASDFNAFTDFDQTVYRLDLAQSDGRARQTALTLMREIATNLAFERRGLATAKQVVRDEIRARDAVQDRILAEQFAFLLPGAPIARGPVAGTEKQVGRATGAALRRLYALYYQPRRATLVVVGDVDPTLAEPELIARFSDWPGGPDVPGVTSPQLSRNRGVEARLLVDPKAPTAVTIASVRPLGSATDTGGGRGAYYLEQLGSELLGGRLERLAAAPAAPFTSATAGVYNYFALARIASIDLPARAGDWRATLQAGGRALREALEQGFSQAELDAHLATLRGAPVRPRLAATSPALADAIVDAVDRDIVYTQPGDPAASAAYLATIRLDDVNAAFRAAWSDRSRLLFVSHNRPVPEGQAAIAEAWSEIGSAR